MKSEARANRLVIAILLFTLVIGGIYISFAPGVANAEGGGGDPITADTVIISPPTGPDPAEDVSILWTVLAVFQAMP
jgi:hypothetical protein